MYNEVIYDEDIIGLVDVGYQHRIEIVVVVSSLFEAARYIKLESLGGAD
jgi:hypothetical protein